VDGTYMLNRIWLFKQGTATTPPEVHYSKLLPSMSSPSTEFNRDGVSVSSAIAGRLQLSPNKGGRARAIAPWNETSLMAFFDSSIEEILIVSANPQADSLRRVIEPNIGCLSPRSVVVVGNEMYFVDQYAQVRSLQQTVTAAQGGVIPKPLSEPIAREIPGKVNKLQLAKIKVVVYKDHLYVAYPRLNSTECNAVAIYSLSRKIWESIWLPASPVGHWFISDIRNKIGEEIWTSDGGADAPAGIYPKRGRVFRWFPGTYNDDGTAIEYREVSRRSDAQAPEAEKIARVLELEAKGTAEAVARVFISVDEDGVHKKLDEDFIIDVDEGGSFPLTNTDPPFPLTDPPDFPLKDALPGITRKKWSLYQLDNKGRGRSFQLTIVANTLSKRFSRSGYRFTSEVQPFEEED
jgi:hypothetical protein